MNTSKLEGRDHKCIKHVLREHHYLLRSLLMQHDLMREVHKNFWPLHFNGSHGYIPDIFTHSELKEEVKC